MVTETVDIRPKICCTPVYSRDTITLARIILIILFATPHTKPRVSNREIN